MSNRALNWAFDQDVSPAGAKFVLVALADFADEAHSCYPAQERLARMTGQSVASVGRHLTALERAGFIARQRRTSARGYRTSDRFVLHVNMPTRQFANNAETQSPTHQFVPGLPVNLREEPSVEPPTEPPGTPIVPAAADELFDRFWSTYPRRAGKQAARKAWDKAIATTDPEVIIAAAAAHADDPNRVQQYTAHPSTWLNQGRWEDDPLPDRTAPRGTSHGDRVRDVLTREREWALAADAAENEQLQIGAAQ